MTDQEIRVQTIKQWPNSELISYRQVGKDISKNFKGDSMKNGVTIDSNCWITPAPDGTYMPYDKALTWHSSYQKKNPRAGLTRQKLTQN